ncbi:MAG: hypothetical protein ACXWTT_00935 [Methylobacter sp.]
MNKLKVSFNDQWVGKPIKDDDGKLWYGGKQIYPGYGWINCEESFDEIFDALTVTGLAIGPAVQDGRRIKENFISHSLALVDIDEGMTIEELLDDDFYQSYGAGYYISPSHTDDNHRFRIIFRLEQDITNYNELRFLYIGLQTVFNKADTKCRDGSRLFYGTIQAQRKEIRPNILPSKMIKALIIVGRDEDSKPFDINPVSQYKIQWNEPSDHYKKKVIEFLQQSFVGDYEVWKRIGWGLKQGGYTLQDFKFVTTGMMNKKSPQAAEIVWKDGKGEITMGTVIHFLKDRYGIDWDKDIRPSTPKTAYSEEDRKIASLYLQLKNFN